MTVSKKNSDPLPTGSKNTAAEKHQSTGRYPWVLLAALLAALLTAAVIGGSGWKRWKDVSSERDVLLVEVESLQHQLKEVQVMEPFEDIKIFSLYSESDDSGKAIIAWNQRLQKGILEISHLAPNPEDSSYVIWIRDESKTEPFPGGKFTVEKEGNLRIPFIPESKEIQPVGFAISKKGSERIEQPLRHIVFYSSNFHG